MKVLVVQSGSNGNCVYVETRRTRLLLDAGVGVQRVQRAVGSCGGDLRELTALLISHEHSDHIRSAGPLQRRFGVPIYMTRRTLAAVERSAGASLEEVRHFAAGETIEFADVAVHTIRTPHDCVEGVAFIVDDGRKRLGILTDLGHVFDGLDRIIRSLDAVILESNYDPQMLESGPYPLWLKQRIRGPGGHLSNEESAELVRASASSRLRWICLAHLSQRNNEPAIALRTHRRIVPQRLPLRVASRHEATGPFEL